MLTDFFLYAEVGVAFLTLLTDWRAAVAYLVVAGLVGALCRQPHYDGPHAIRSLSPPAFLKSVYDSGDSLTGSAGAAKPASGGKYQGPAWLVAFVDPKAPLCIHVRARRLQPRSQVLETRAQATEGGREPEHDADSYPDPGAAQSRSCTFISCWKIKTDSEVYLQTSLAQAGTIITKRSDLQ